MDIKNNKKIKVVLVGGGGHALICKEIFCENKTSIYGFVDIKKNAKLSKTGLRYLGTDENIPNLIQEGCNFFIFL